ncbi:RAB11-binding protein RELCH homolog isoform X2 [Ixodes scapularis]|uniref:RAB11-binding protein RELCH homolog isoform X2 n=1 Tax=Ixodes scapularis TaxID=6945 RepID=UPI001C384A3E|nr:RAB11-binding protein RELCH homolog isoform X2 [Ixodes scapularis]
MAGTLEVETLEDEISKCNQASDDAPISLPPPVELESVHDVTIDRIASKLLKDNFILTALELHAELLESGRELPRLRDYFSNPGNFEKHSHSSAFDVSPVLPRTSSVQTFDSLDFARYSDDGEKQLDERVAVLEFELRKARETIKNLRANLTVVTESDPNTPDNGSEHTTVSEDPLRPHERRAVNFLVNEYLLKQDYKLTSITFSDENEDQDFEDWDDVGLNIPKPPDFLQLYRNYNKHARQWCSTTECAAQTEALDEPSPSAREQELKAVAFEKEVLETQVEQLKLQLEKANQENAALTSELDKALNSQAELSFKPVLPFEIMAETLSEMVEPSVPDSPLLTASKSPLRKRLPEERGNLPEEGSPIDSTFHKDDLDVAVFGVEQVTPAKLRESRPITTARCVVWRRKMSPAFLEALVSVGHPQSQLADMRLAWDVTHVAATGDEVVLMLSRCLPHIVPNVLLAKREELVPLLLAAINLHPDARERDALLNLLFNLTKRPDDDQRRVILAGLLSVAQCLGHARVEAELLPQCWEQISHKYPERRLLVAESCGYLAPQVASEIRSSLLLSMLQQMLKEEKEELVRQAAARSLAVLLAYVDDPDKFLQAVDLALLVVADEQPEMAEVAQSVLLPSVACWALEKGQLETALLTTLMKLLEDHVRALDMRSADGVMSLSQAEEQHSVNLVKALGAALPFLLVHVLESAPYVARLNLHDSISPCSLPADRLRPSENPLLEPATIVGDDSRTALLVTAFDEHIGQEWFKTWPAFDWLLSKFIPFLTNIATSTKPHSRSTVRALSELVRNFCQLFGCTFTHSKVKPAFSALLPLTDASSVASREALTNATAPIYACGVLTAFCSETDRRELVGFLKSLLFVVSLCDVSLASIQSTLLELGCDRNHQETLLAALWEGVVHASPLVRANAARLFELLVATVPDTLLKNRVAPALVTLASDPEISVRVGTVRPFGTILALSTQKELLDKAFLQLQTFLEDPQHRDNHCMQVEFIQMFASLGPNTEPRFRDEFILPHLAVLAIRNNQNASDSLRAEVAELLLEAYTALSCTYIPEQVISEAFLPGLRCLLEDARQVAPCHEAAVAAMIGNFEAKLDCSRDRTSSLTSPIASMEEMKRKMTKIFTTPPANARANLPNIFQLRKK